MGLLFKIEIISPEKAGILALISTWTKIFTVIASEAKQSQPLRLLHSASLRDATRTLHSQ
ncbi:hypothetical protein FDUTEX481_00846 [Tolypothrix sp. PCC 7601]|nr:hypothetical protein FDUTEX481_00846 [Tolypothrix sp. PCC 7601]